MLRSEVGLTTMSNDQLLCKDLENNIICSGGRNVCRDEDSVWKVEQSLRTKLHFLLSVGADLPACAGSECHHELPPETKPIEYVGLRQLYSNTTVQQYHRRHIDVAARKDEKDSLTRPILSRTCSSRAYEPTRYEIVDCKSNVSRTPPRSDKISNDSCASTPMCCNRAIAQRPFISQILSPREGNDLQVFPDESHLPSPLDVLITNFCSTVIPPIQRLFKYSVLILLFLWLAEPFSEQVDALLVHNYSGGFRGVPGRYCADLPTNNGQEQCCSSRNDSCAVPIAGTMCYCDIFCDRRPGAHPAERKDPTGASYYDYGDCCPDFWCHCRGELDQCLYGPQSPFTTRTPAMQSQQDVTTMFMLSAQQSPVATAAPPRRARVSQQQLPSASAIDDYYFDHSMQQQPPISADHNYDQQRPSFQQSSTDDDAACCHYYHDDDADGLQYLPNPIVINQGDTIRINCNTCTCKTQQRRSRSSSSSTNGRSAGPYLPDVECTKHICLMEPHFITHLNTHWKSYGWQAATNYSQYWDKTLQWGLKHRLGTHAPTSDAFNMIPMRVHGARIETIPKEFDARERWRSSRGTALADIVDQGSCGGSWAFSTVQVAQDRLNVIFTNRRRRNMYHAPAPSLLSVQQLLACDRKRNQLGCDGGGHVDRAWWYMRKKGVVSESCYPTRTNWWSSNDDDNDNNFQQQQQQQQRMTPRCELSKPQQSGNQAVVCPASRAQSTRYKMSPAYRIAPVEAEIQTEILRNGPVQAIIRVRPDFFMYKRGVYKHTETLAQDLAAEKYHAYYHHQDLEEYYQPQQQHHNRTAYAAAPPLPPPLPEPLEAHHAVRIVGWGVDYTSDRPLKYWECANTWGTWWGLNGYFRVLRGAADSESESDVERFIIGVWPRRPVRVDNDKEEPTSSGTEASKDNKNNANDRQNDNNNKTSRRLKQLSNRKRERRRLKKTLQQQRRQERFFKQQSSNNSKRHKRLQKRKLMMGLKPRYSSYYYDYMDDDSNSQLERLKRLSRAVESARRQSDAI